MSNQLEATRWSRRQRGQPAPTTAPPGFAHLPTGLLSQPTIPTSNTSTATPAVPTLTTPVTQSLIPPFAMPAPQIPGMTLPNATPAYHHHDASSAPPYHATPAYQHHSTQPYFSQPLPPLSQTFNSLHQHPSTSSSDVTSVYVQPTPPPTTVPYPYPATYQYNPYGTNHAQPPIDENMNMLQHMNRIQAQMKSDHIALEKRFNDTLTTTVKELSKALKEAMQAPPIPEIQYSSASSSTLSSNLIDLESKMAPPTTTTTLPQVPPAVIPSIVPSSTTAPITTTAPIPSATPANEPTQLDLMKLLLQHKEPTKIHFTPLSEHTDIQNWTYMSALECSKTHKYKDLTTRNERNQICFKTLLTVEQSETLYLLIHKAIGKMNRKLILDTDNPNGLLLLDQVHCMYMKTDTSVGNQDTLLAEFNSLTKNDTEDITTFAIRFSKKMKELDLSNVTYDKSPQAVSYKFLKGLQEHQINVQILMTLPSKPEWWSNLSLLEIASKAENFIKQYKTLLPRKKTKSQDTPSPKQDDKSTGPSQKDLSKIREDKVYKELSNATDVRELLQKWKKSNTEKFRDISTKRACNRADCYAIYKQLESNRPDNNGTRLREAVTEKKTQAAARRAAADKAQATALADAVEKVMTNQFAALMDQMGGDSDDDASETVTEEENNSNTDITDYSTLLPPYLTNMITNHFIKLQSLLKSHRRKKRKIKIPKPLQPPINCQQIIPTITPETPTNVLAKCKHISTSANSTTTAIADSGATHNMSGDKSLFESITYYETPPQVMLGDETTFHPIEGYGWINFLTGDKRIRLRALFIPGLGKTTLLSIKQHMKWKGNFFHAEANQAILAFPTFVINLTTKHEIELQLSPASKLHNNIDFDEYKAIAIKTKGQLKSLKLISSEINRYIPHGKAQLPFTKQVQIMKLTPTASLPERGTKGSIGYDVKTQERVILQPGAITKIPTGLSTAFPSDMYLRIAPRSSLSAQNITVEGGVVDSDFRGDIVVLLKNHSSVPIILEPKTKMAQFIFEQANVPYIHVVTTLPQSVRNKGGFGSTNNPKGKRSAFQTFRLNDEYVLHMNNTNPFRQVARRVRSPIANPLIIDETQQPSTNVELIHKDAVKDAAITKLIIKPAPPQNKITPDPTPIIPITAPSPQPDPNSNHATPDTRPDSESTRPPTEAVYNPLEVHQLNDDEGTDVDKVLDMDSESLVRPSEPNADTSQSIRHIPIPVDTVNASLPKNIVMSRDALHRAIGFQNSTVLLKNIHKLGTKSVTIQNLPKVEQVDPGETASMHSSRRNTTAKSIPTSYSDIWHMDIGYGPETSIGGIRYTLLFVDKFSRYKFVYGLKNLTSSLLSAVKKFINDVGTHPSLIRTDFDHKLIGGNVAKFLQEEEKIRLESAPPYRQHQNGLVERHWQTIVNMARNWLRSSMLPTTYWYFAIKRAVEVSNVMPLKFKDDDKITTPYEKVFNKKVDYRMLFPMFSISYIKQHRENGQDKTNWTSKSLKCIVVGKCNKSNSLIFYHPPSKQTLSCGDGYRFDTVSPAGPQFGQQYEGDFYFNTKAATNIIHRPPVHEQNKTVYVQTDGHIIKGKIIDIPIDDEQGVYTIQEVETGDIQQYIAEELLDHDPTANPQDIVDSLPIPFANLPWIKSEAKVTLFLQHTMKKPKQGYLFFNPDTKAWQFLQGRKRNNKNPPIDLNNFPELVESLLDNKKLFKGWVATAKAMTARRVSATSNLVAGLIINKKVSAKDLHLMEAPTLLKHHKLHSDDRKTWDESYRQEYQGLVDIDTWEYISESDYLDSKHMFGNLLPTMAISTIKHDGEGQPTRAKYRIVALGNLDPHDWTKQDCFAPVLSQMELRLLTAIAVRNRCVPKTGDITQAFCQSYLPKGEDYVCRPPPGCPITPSQTYLRLKKTLYGLKRSPRHFYELAVKTLNSIGMYQHPYSPCLFIGTPIAGEPPLYLGLYVDDFIYFSTNRKVEEKFEKSFKAKLDMDLSGDISYFLGIKFTPKRHDKHVTIKLSQEAFIDTLAALAKLDGDGVNEPKSPYRNGLPIDKIPASTTTDPELQRKHNALLQTLVGSLNWLSISTRPDIQPVTNMLAQYTTKASTGHIHAAKWIIKYLKGSKTEGIVFSSTDRSDLNSFVKFPIDPAQIVSLTDANWGPQDQSTPKEGQKLPELDLFKSRSLSGFLIWLGGPIHWVSKRQSITARSSAEAEIYATDECIKQLLHLSYILDGYDLCKALMPSPTQVYNDNMACVCWSKTTTTKGLRHIQMRENAIRESIYNNFATVNHIEGKVNLADLFTKEDKDPAHFIRIRDMIMGAALWEALRNSK